MIMATLGMALMATCVKLAGTEINAFEKLFFSNIIAVLAAFYSMKKASLSMKPSSKEGLKFLLYRAFAGLGGGVFFFYAISHLPLADSAMLNKLSPFWVIIIASFFFKRELS